VYPAQRALDTMVVSADGRLTFRFASAPPDTAVYTRWKLGSLLMPEGLCTGPDSVPLHVTSWFCRGYLLVGDTVWIAGRDHLTYLRARLGGAQDTIKPWATPHGNPKSPAVGAAARGGDPSRVRKAPSGTK
jgi:hypothetical protein